MGDSHELMTIASDQKGMSNCRSCNYLFGLQWMNCEYAIRISENAFYVAMTRARKSLHYL